MAAKPAREGESELVCLACQAVLRSQGQVGGAPARFARSAANAIIDSIVSAE